MKHLSNFHYLVFLFCAELLFSAPSQAGHLAGAEISYTHLNGNMYRLHLTFYRDCMGIFAPTIVNIKAVSLSCQDSATYTLQQVGGTGNEITMPCPGHSTTCDGGSEPGIQKWEYEADVAITAPCPDWTFSYSECCIGGNVQQTDLLVKAMLNNSISDNNSPQFTNNPILFWCIDADDHFNNGMFDLDGDSLVSHLIDLPGATYIFPHTGQQPFNSVPPITMDSVSGDFLMHPVTVEVGWIAFEMLDYRNGVLMGSTMRILTYYMVPCTNTPPTASGMNGTLQDSIFVFPDDTVCFDILSDDVDAWQELTMSWDQTIPTATFDTAGGPQPIGSFCWTPTINDVRPHPYIFTVMVVDNNCPTHGAGIFGYRIYVTLDSSLVWAGTNHIDIGDDISIYPNPSGGIFETRSTEKIKQINIFDQFGRCVLTVSGEPFDLASFAPGVYVAEITTAGNRTLRQFILKK